MNQDKKTRLSSQKSPHNDRNPRSKSRILAARQSRPMYLTEGQFCSSQHTIISSSQITLFRIQLQSKLKKLQHQNTQLKQTIISLKASKFYELDEQKIKSVIRENQALKARVSGLQSDVRLLDETVTSLMVQNQYLRRNNKVLKTDVERGIRQAVRDKHDYLGLEGRIKRGNYGGGYGGQNYEVEIQLQLSSKQKVRDSERSQLIKLLDQKKLLSRQNQTQKQSQNQQSLDSQQRSKRRLTRNNSTHRSSSKSIQKAVVPSFTGSKALLKKPSKKQPSDISSTTQSQGLSIKHYSSNGNLSNLRGQRREMKVVTSRNQHEMEYVNYRKQEQVVSPDYNGEYFNRQKLTTSKKKKSIYYN